MPSHPFLLRDDENELASPRLPFASIFVRFANGETLRISRDDLPDTAIISGYATVRDLKEAVAERLSTAGHPGVDEDAESVVGSERRVFQYVPPTLIDFFAEQERDPSSSTSGDQTNASGSTRSECGSTAGLFLPDHHPLAALSQEGRDELRVIIRGTLRSFANARVVRLPGPPDSGRLYHRLIYNQRSPWSWMNVEDGRATAEIQRADAELDAVFRVWQKWVPADCCEDLLAFVFPPSEDTGNAFPVTLTRREILREVIYMMDDCQLCSRLFNISIPAYYCTLDDSGDYGGYWFGAEYHCVSALTAAYAVDPQGAARDVLLRLQQILRSGGKDSNPHAAAAAAVFSERIGFHHRALLWCALTAADEAFALEVLTARKDSRSEDVDPSGARETSFCFDLFDTLHSPVREVNSYESWLQGYMCDNGAWGSGFAWMLKWSRSAQFWAAVLNRPELHARLRIRRRLFEDAVRAESGDPYQSGLLLLLDADNIQTVDEDEFETEYYNFVGNFYDWSLDIDWSGVCRCCYTLEELVWRRLEDPAADIATCGDWYAVLAVFFSAYLHDDDTEPVGKKADRFAFFIEKLFIESQKGGTDLIGSLIAHLKYLIEDLSAIAATPSSETWRHYSSTAERVFRFLFYNEVNAPLISEPLRDGVGHRLKSTFAEDDGGGPSSAPGARERSLSHHEAGQRCDWVRNLLRKLRLLLVGLQRLWRRHGCEQRFRLSRTDELLRHFRKLGVAQNGVCDFLYHIRNAQGDQEAWKTRGEGLHSHNRPERQKKNRRRYSGSDADVMTWEEQLDLDDLLVKDVRIAARAATKKRSRATGRCKGTGCSN